MCPSCLEITVLRYCQTVRSSHLCVKPHPIRDLPVYGRLMWSGCPGCFRNAWHVAKFCHKIAGKIMNKLICLSRDRKQWTTRDKYLKKTQKISIGWRQRFNSAMPLQRENFAKPTATPMPNPKHDQRSQEARGPRGRTFRGSAWNGSGRRETAMDVEPMTIKN